MRTFTTLHPWVLAVATVVLVVGCDRVNLTAPTGSTVSLSVERNVIPLGGQTSVTAVVTESAGTPVQNGTFVTFQTTLGSFNPPQAQTTDGVAITTFLAGSNSGTAQLSAFSGGARTGGNGSGGGVTIKIGAAAASGNISVTATPPSVSQSGGTVTISAIVFDEASNPLPGVNVQFVASTGTLTATTATTDSSGIARTQLSTTQTATVSAFAGAAKGEVRVEVSAAPPVQFTVAPEPAIAGSPVAITVSSNSSAGARQIQSVTLDFGDGTSETRTNVTGSAAFTHIYQREGAVTLSARVVDVAGNTGLATRALVVTRAVPSAGVSAAPNFGTAPLNVTITTTASTAAGNPPIESVSTFIDGVLYHSSSGPGSFAVRFTTPGNKRVETVVRDTAGNESRANTIVVVN